MKITAYLTAICYENDDTMLYNCESLEFGTFFY